MWHHCIPWLNTSCFLQEREDPPEDPALNLTSTTQYLYNAIHSEAQVKVSWYWYMSYLRRTTKWSHLQLYICCHGSGCLLHEILSSDCDSDCLTLFLFNRFQTFQKVCPVCSKSVVHLVAVQYYPCKCIRQMCCDCDAELEKSGTDCCVNHFLSERHIPRRRTKTCTWLFIHLFV